MRCKLSILLFTVAFYLSVATVHAGPVEFRFAHFVNPIEPGPESCVGIEKELLDKIKALSASF